MKIVQAQQQERKFFKLAAHWMMCRLLVLQGPVSPYAIKFGKYDIRDAIMGETDHEWAMKLLIKNQSHIFQSQNLYQKKTQEMVCLCLQDAALCLSLSQ